MERGVSTGAASAVSGIEAVNLVTRERNVSIVLAAWTRTILKINLRYVGEQTFLCQLGDGILQGVFYLRNLRLRSTPLLHLVPLILHFAHVRRDLVRIVQMLVLKPFFETSISAEYSMESTFGPRCFAIFPRQIVVFVRIPGCSSLCVFAKYFNKSPLIFRSFNCLINPSPRMKLPLV